MEIQLHLERKRRKRIRHLQTINYGEISKLPCLATSLGIATIATFSVVGMATIFAGAFLGTVVMMSALEFGKIVTATYTFILGQTQLHEILSHFIGGDTHVNHFIGYIWIPI